VELPAEAEDHDFMDRTGVQVFMTDPESGDLATVSFGECGDEMVDELWGSVPVDSAFADCAPRQSCTRTFCLAITSKDDPLVEGQWRIWTTIRSLDTVKHEDDSIRVPIEITIEEIEP
jgi:hypothetical protein